MTNEFKLGRRPFSVAVAPRHEVSNLPWRPRDGDFVLSDVRTPWAYVRWVEWEYIDRSRDCWVCALMNESTGETVDISVRLSLIDSVKEEILDKYRRDVRAEAISKSKYPTAEVTA